jgi:hypothetical protein
VKFLAFGRKKVLDKTAQASKFEFYEKLLGNLFEELF